MSSSNVTSYNYSELETDAHGFGIQEESEYPPAMDAELLVCEAASKKKAGTEDKSKSAAWVPILKRPVTKTYDHPLRREAIRCEIELAKVTQSHRTPIMKKVKQSAPPYIKRKRTVFRN